MLRRPWLALANRSDQGLPPEQLWDRHGTQLFALASTLLGEERAAVRAVTLGMTDLYTPVDADPDSAVDESLQTAARCVYGRCHAILAESSTRRSTTVPLMVLLGELAENQRGVLALCVFGGHDYREAAHLLDLPPAAAASLLTSALQELGALAAAQPVRGDAGNEHKQHPDW